jgi:corrinoid protein of di/trimethylamine methyltransferase
MRNEELYEALSAAVVDMDEEAAAEAAQSVVDEGYDAFGAIDKGLAEGMKEAGDLFETGEYFVPELLMCAEAMNAGTDILTPHIQRRESEKKKVVVIGVVEGDTHDIGKNLVALMLDANGFEVIDLGRDIPPRQFVDEARKQSADIIAISTLMTTTMDGMTEVIRLLNEENTRDLYKVIVGGAPISLKFANEIGADGYSRNAADAVRLVRQLTEEVEADIPLIEAAAKIPSTLEGKDLVDGEVPLPAIGGVG